MALKAVLASKAEVDALPESVRGLYEEKDGRFILAVEGGIANPAEVTELKTRLAEFRDNNRTMHGELEKLRPLATKFEGIDPDEYQALKKEQTDLKSKGINSINDIQTAIDKAVQTAVKPLADKLTQESAAREAAQKAVNAATFRELVTADATKAGVAPSAIRHVLREAESVFDLKDGTLVAKAGQKHPTDPLKDLMPTDWLSNLAKTDEYLFAPNLGSGAGGPGAGGTSGGNNRPNAKRLINPSPEEMGRNMDAIAKGELVVVRQ